MPNDVNPFAEPDIVKSRDWLTKLTVDPDWEPKQRQIQLLVVTDNGCVPSLTGSVGNHDPPLEESGAAALVSLHNMETGGEHTSLSVPQCQHRRTHWRPAISWNWDWPSVARGVNREGGIQEFLGDASCGQS